MITEAQQPDSRYHIETDAGEFWSPTRKEAITFARTHESAQVWEIDTDKCVYHAEA